MDLAGQAGMPRAPRVSTIAKLEPGTRASCPHGPGRAGRDASRSQGLDDCQVRTWYAGILPAWTWPGRQDACAPRSRFAYDLSHGFRSTLCARESAGREHIPHEFQVIAHLTDSGLVEKYRSYLASDSFSRSLSLHQLGHYPTPGDQ